MYISYTLFAFVVSAIMGYLVIPRIVFISKAKRLFDHPNARSVHSDLVPRLGGVAFFPCFLFSVALILALRYQFGLEILSYPLDKLLTETLYFLLGMIILYLVGIGDDLVGVRYKTKFVAQIVATTFMITGGVYITSFHGFLGIYSVPWYLGVPMTYLLVVFVINAINLIDGIDGLASGLSFIALTSFGVWFLIQGFFMSAILAFAMTGVLASFFRFNFFSKRWKIFMGDTGSLGLGFLIAYLSCRLCMLAEQPEHYTDSAPILVFAFLYIPLFDALRVFLDRIRRGVSPFVADKSHIHHKMLALGLSKSKALFVILIAQVLIIAIHVVLIPFININVMLLIDLLVGFGGSLYLHRLPGKKRK